MAEPTIQEMFGDSVVVDAVNGTLSFSLAELSPELTVDSSAEAIFAAIFKRIYNSQDKLPDSQLVIGNPELQVIRRLNAPFIRHRYQTDFFVAASDLPISSF